MQYFRSVAAHLTDEGQFVIEAFMPNLACFEAGQATRLTNLDEETMRLDAAEHAEAKQRIASQHVVLSRDGVELYPIKLRYAWPSELDLMARLSGLTLRNRWASWRREPFTGDSRKPVSVCAQR